MQQSFLGHIRTTLKSILHTFPEYYNTVLLLSSAENAFVRVLKDPFRNVIQMIR